MDIYALLSLIASAICVPLGVSVYFMNRKSVANRLFMYIMLANAYWAFCQFMLTESTSLDSAAIWAKSIFLWPFLVAFMLHFTLVFTESDLLKHKMVYLALYFPALSFSLVDLTTNWISSAPVLMPWGYSTSVPLYSVLSRIDGVWGAVVELLALFLFATYYTRVIDKTKKQQTKFVALAFAVPVCLSLITDSLFAVMKVNFPGLGAISGSFASFFVLYAMWRYELFGFRPEIALENVFSNMVDSVVLVDLRGVIVKVNRSLVELSGYSEVDIIGKTVTTIVQKATVLGKEKMPLHIMAELRKRRELKNYEFTFISKSGQTKNCVLTCSMVSDSRGSDVGIAFVVHDVTEHKEMEHKLLRAERLASIGELAGLLGNDLRNPLNAIVVASYYLKTKYANVLDSKDTVMLQSIEKSIDYSNKIINDLIDYSSEINLEYEIATPKSLVNSAIALVELPQNINFKDETQKQPEFPVDTGRMRRIFVNVIKNAFDAMPNGGDLTVTSEVNGEMVVFCFEDTGCGMTPDVLAKIWTPLFTTKAKGMGFGLAICRRVVEGHDGKISAESQPNVGTKVKIELPVKMK